MREVKVRIGVLAALTAVVPLLAVGLAANGDLDDLFSAAILALVLLAAVYGGWAVRDGYHRWFGWWGPLAWAGIGSLSALGPLIGFTIVDGGIGGWAEVLRMYAAVALAAVAWTVIWWLVGRAMPVGSFDVRDEPVRG